MDLSKKEEGKNDLADIYNPDLEYWYLYYYSMMS